MFSVAFSEIILIVVVAALLLDAKDIKKLAKIYKNISLYIREQKELIERYNKEMPITSVENYLSSLPLELQRKYSNKQLAALIKNNKVLQLDSKKNLNI